jgi:hypothetical protein
MQLGSETVPGTVPLWSNGCHAAHTTRLVQMCCIHVDALAAATAGHGCVTVLVFCTLQVGGQTFQGPGVWHVKNVIGTVQAYASKESR